MKKEERLEPDVVLQARMEHHFRIAKAEMDKGEDGSITMIEEHLEKAQKAATELAPFRIARKAPTDQNDDKDRTNRVVRLPRGRFTSLEEWRAAYEPVINGKTDAVN